MLSGHLGINIDIASTVFRKGGISVLEYLQDTLNCRNVDDISKMSRKSIEQALFQVNVVTTHRGDLKQRFRVAKIGESAASYKFTGNDGKETSVAEYFKKELKITVRYPNLPLVFKANKKTAFPMEFLEIVPAQRFKNKLNGDQISEMIRATVQKPSDRMHEIEMAVKNNLKYKENPYLESFGLKVGDEMMTVPARVLPAPKVVFKNNIKLSGNEGAWRINNTKVPIF